MQGRYWDNCYTTLWSARNMAEIVATEVEDVVEVEDSDEKLDDDSTSDKDE